MPVDGAVNLLRFWMQLQMYISWSNNVPYIHVKNGSKDLKIYPQISRRVRDTLARLFSMMLP